MERHSTYSSIPNVPHFVGRKRELAKIADALASDSRGWGVMITGPGGIGKTSLAIVAAHNAAEDDFQIKIFLSAKRKELTAEGETPTSDYSLADFDELMSELALELGTEDVKQTPVSQRASLVRRILAEKKALIVFDNVETFKKEERERLLQFINRLPYSCKAIVTSRRSVDIEARVIRLNRLQLDEALQLMNELAQDNAALARASKHDLEALYERAGGNPLLINWVCGQLARDGVFCNTIREACKLLESAPPDNDPLEFAFGNLLDTFGPTEIAVLSALTYFSEPAESDSIAVLAQLAGEVAEAALERLSDRALLETDENRERFFLPTLTTTFLRRVRPETVEQAGDQLFKNVFALVKEYGDKRYEYFPRLETQWLSIATALKLVHKSDNINLQWFCDGISTFLDFSGRQDELLSLCRIAEEKASTAQAFNTAATRAYQIGCVFALRKQADEVSDATARCKRYWNLHIDQVNLGKSEDALIRLSKHEQAMICRLTGLLHQLNGDYPRAKEELLKARELHESVGQNKELLLVMNDLGLLHAAMRETFYSELYLKNALKIASKSNFREETLLCLRSLSRVKHGSDDSGEARLLSRKGLRLAQALNCNRLIKEFEYQLS
jgi:hypothetical protein